MLFSEAKGHKVVSTSTADTIAKVSGFVVDARSRLVVAVEVKKTKAGEVIVWDALSSFGTDAVTVASEECITDATGDIDTLSHKDHSILGKRVLTTSGSDLGVVQDVDFDPESGSVTSLVMKSTSIPGFDLVGAGSYAVVVRPQ
ncbi:PRC-barrel domain-containing protein [Rhodococcus sp. NBC_00297]|uniref:PRC-barrel domain-containing protein n=1 Tax=Rhodococcus sp. NBC_00297 TaxID=2976005 RepID=UPI002E2A00D1|nr:PRC-barrel domain-containing protein [Rhodococcus sp. NBC_00297]